MAVSTITLESSNGDSVVVSAPNDEYLADDIILDTNPEGIYDTGFTVRTQSGAFEPGGRIVGDEVPIRELVLPFWLAPASRPRFQKLWGTPGSFRKVRWHYDGPSGRRSLTLRLSKEIEYITEEGFDADIDGVYHAVVSAIAVNPMYEGVEDVAEWANPGNFTVYIAATSGTFKLGYADELTNPIAVDGGQGTILAALEALPGLGAGNVSVSTVQYHAAGTIREFTVQTPATKPGMLTVDNTSLAPISFSVSIGALDFTIEVGGESTGPIGFFSSASTIRQALGQLSTVGADGVDVSGTFFGFTLGFTSGPLNGFVVALLTGKSRAGFHAARVVPNPNTGWFDVWNPTDQPLWLEWTFDPADEWAFPDFSFGQERKWGRAVGEDADRMIVTPELTQILSVMADPFLDTYVNADLSNAAGLFNGVEPVYMVPPYTGTADDPVLMPVVCRGPAGNRATLRQRRYWSAESGLNEE